MSKKVLIVDDAMTIRQLVKFTLTGAGYEVIDAVNGVDALGKLDGQKIEIVISDVNMPQMDGIEFVRQLRTKKGYKFTPVLMLTTESAEDKKNAAKSAGASGWIVKPFVPEQLLSVVNKFIG